MEVASDRVHGEGQPSRGSPGGFEWDIRQGIESGVYQMKKAAANLH
jgi:hypothetical protein